MRHAWAYRILFIILISRSGLLNLPHRRQTDRAICTSVRRSSQQQLGPLRTSLLTIHPPTYLPHLPTYLPTLLTHPPHYLNSQQHLHCVHGSHDRRLSLAAPTGPLHLSTCSSLPIDYRNLLHRFFVFCFFFFFCCRRRCLVSTLTPLLYHSVSHYPCNSRVPSCRARVLADTSSLAHFLVY